MPEHNIFDDIPEHYPVDWILDNFDFEKVHRYMTFGNWVWMGSAGVPSISDLKKCAKRLLEDMRKNTDDEINSMGTGGFVVHKYDNRLQLQFVLESWDEYELEELGDELDEGWKK